MPVLGTKLRAPAPRRRLVPRERLVDRLQADPTTMPRLVLMSAPAGFGKIGDLTLVRLDDGTTSLTGPVVDQAHLHGVLVRIRDLGVPLLMLCTLDSAGAGSGSPA
jgi:hypothetical protein